MKEKVINWFMNKYEIQNKYTQDELVAIKYGVEGYYLTITKLIVITFLAIILGLFKPYILFVFFYIPLRSVSFGWHANKSIECWILSTIAFLLIPYLATLLNLTNLMKFTLLFITALIYLLYSPADTKKRPIVNTKRRIIYKLLSISIIIIYSIFILKFNTLLTNCMLLACMSESLLINPLIYSISKQSYNNYQNYKLMEE